MRTIVTCAMRDANAFFMRIIANLSQASVFYSDNEFRDFLQLPSTRASLFGRVTLLQSEAEGGRIIKNELERE